MQSPLEVSPVIGVEPDASFSRSQSVNHGLCHPRLWGAPTYISRLPHNRTDDIAIDQCSKRCLPCCVSRSRCGSGLGALMRLPRFCICRSKRPLSSLCCRHGLKSWLSRWANYSGCASQKLNLDALPVTYMPPSGAAFAFSEPEEALWKQEGAKACGAMRSKRRRTWATSDLFGVPG